MDNLSPTQLKKQNREIQILIKEGNLDAVNKMLDRGFSVNGFTTTDGWTPLHQAVSQQNITITKMLLERGANTETVTDLNSTPLHVAASVGNEELIKLLLAADAQITVPNKSGFTVIDVARETHYEKLATYLQEIEQGTRSRPTPESIGLNKDKRNAALEALEALKAEMTPPIAGKHTENIVMQRDRARSDPNQGM